MVIVGAKGLAKELLTVLTWNGEAGNLSFFDNINEDIPDSLYDRFPVLKSWAALEVEFQEKSCEFILGVGGTKTRKSLAAKLESLGGKLCSVTSDQALIGQYGNRIGNGVCILSHATLTADVCIGEGSLINKGAMISHDTKIGCYCEISPGAKILGRSIIGDGTEIGTNAVILPDVIVGSNCKIGAGAVVTKHVPDGSVVVGIPARPVGK